MTITPPSKLTICTWNCNGALRHKLGQIDSLDADILIIQECEDPAQSQDAAYRTWAGENYAWIGTTASKGLGIFPRRNLAIEPLRWTHEARFFLPRAVAGVPVCAVWAHRATRKGDELHPSFFLQRNLAKPYHLDYILTGKAWQIGALRIGAPAEWLACSDHMPLMAELVRPG